jgi:hypothetical protein
MDSFKVDGTRYQLGMRVFCRHGMCGDWLGVADDCDEVNR